MGKFSNSNAGMQVHHINNFISSARRGQKYMTEKNNVDSSLALAFYNFLTEGSNKLPSHEYVNKVIKNSNYDCISIGYGVTVNLEKNEENNILVIELSIPVNDKRDRIDKISPEKHIIYIDHYSRMGRIEVDKDNTKILSKTTNINEKRIEFLQNYLSTLQIKIDEKVKKLK